MNVEQTGVNAIKVTLDTDMEKATIGKANEVRLTIEQTSTAGFRATPEAKKSMMLSRIVEPSDAE